MNYKEEAKTWIDANMHDGEDRKGCVSDYARFNPDDLQELIDDLLDDIIPKALEAQNNDIAKFISEYPYWVDKNGDIGAVGDEHPQNHDVLAEAILNASIGDENAVK